MCFAHIQEQVLRTCKYLAALNICTFYNIKRKCKEKFKAEILLKAEWEDF